MGAAREVTFACLAEPALFLGLLVLAQLRPARSRSSGMLGAGARAHVGDGAARRSRWSRLSLFIVLLAENCRIPFDDPNTHLELTMIHEVMVLDHSGPPLGMILYGAALKLFVFGRAARAPRASRSRSAIAWLDWARLRRGHARARGR